MVYVNNKEQFYRKYYHMTVDLERLNKKGTILKRKTLSQYIHSGTIMLTAVIITLNLVLGTVYFIINGQKTALGYKLRELQLTNESLKNDYKKVENEIVRTTAVKTIESTAEKNKMVNADYVIYSIGASKTAQR